MGAYTKAVTFSEAFLYCQSGFGACSWKSNIFMKVQNPPVDEFTSCQMQ